MCWQDLLETVLNELCKTKSRPGGYRPEYVRQDLLVSSPRTGTVRRGTSRSESYLFPNRTICREPVGIILLLCVRIASSVDLVHAFEAPVAHSSPQLCGWWGHPNNTPRSPSHSVVRNPPLHHHYERARDVVSKHARSGTSRLTVAQPHIFPLPGLRARRAHAGHNLRTGYGALGCRCGRSTRRTRRRRASWT